MSMWDSWQDVFVSNSSEVEVWRGDIALKQDNLAAEKLVWYSDEFRRILTYQETPPVYDGLMLHDIWFSDTDIQGGNICDYS